MRLASGRWLVGALTVFGCSLFSNTDELASRSPGKDAGKIESGSGGGGVAGAGAWATGGADSGLGASSSGGTGGQGGPGGGAGGSSSGGTGGSGATGGSGGTAGGGGGGCGVCPAGTTCDSTAALCVACGSHGGACCGLPAQCAGDADCCSTTGLADRKCYDCQLEPAKCLCLVCCAVCQGGTPKSTPLPVDASQTCDQIANQWCISKGVANGANISNSGWKTGCM